MAPEQVLQQWVNYHLKKSGSERHGFLKKNYK